MTLAYVELNKISRDFRDLSGDLVRSNYNNFKTALNFFKSFCDECQVIHDILQPVLTRDFDTDEWFQNVIESRGSFVGSGNGTLPNNKLDALKVIYDLLWDEKALGKLMSYGQNTMFNKNFDEQLRKVNDSLTNLFVRYVIRQLEDKIELVKPQSKQQMNNWNFYAPANIANQSQYVNQSIQINNPELSSLLVELRNAIINSNISQEEKDDALETTDMIEQEVEKPKFSKGKILKFITLIPQIDKISSCCDSIIQHIDKMIN
jgi:hypothetical protein